MRLKDINNINNGIVRNTILSDTDFSDKRRKTSLVLDVETGVEEKQLIFDIGWTVSEVAHERMVIHRSFIVEEVFLNMDIMTRAHYFGKYPEYVKGIMTGSIDVVSWSKVKETLENDIADFNVSRIFAYNAAFDKKAIKDTQEYIAKGTTYDIDMNCLWSASISAFMQTKKYVQTADANGWYSQKGLGANIGSSAEYAYRFLSGDYDFVEAHTGLEDSIIETQILWAVSKMQTKKEWEIGKMTWKHVRDAQIKYGIEIKTKPKEKVYQEWLKLDECKSTTIKLKDRTVEVIVKEKGE